MSDELDITVVSEPIGNVVMVAPASVDEMVMVALSGTDEMVMVAPAVELPVCVFAQQERPFTVMVSEQIPSPNGVVIGLPPNDGKPYVMRNGSWEELQIT